LINLDKTQQTLIENGYNQLYKFKYKKSKKENITRYKGKKGG
jgi:hypothetical protein